MGLLGARQTQGRCRITASWASYRLTHAACYAPLFLCVTQQHIIRQDSWLTLFINQCNLAVKDVLSSVHGV